MSFKDYFRKRKHTHRITKALDELASRQQSSQPHNLNGELIISLTSFSKKFGNLAPTVRSLLLQDITPDAVVLWVSHDDFELLPQDVLECQKLGLQIRQTIDIRSYTKLIPSLEAFQNAYIITADDDVYYEKSWLRELVEGHISSGAEIVCHRAHNITLHENGRPKPYEDWEQNIATAQRSRLIFPTGVSGILYTPGCFHSDVSNKALFQKLCPTADDIWFYWMHRMAGCRAHKIGERRRILEWDMNPDSGLRQLNVLQGGNNTQLQAMIEHYGFPD